MPADDDSSCGWSALAASQSEAGSDGGWSDLAAAAPDAAPQSEAGSDGGWSDLAAAAAVDVEPTSAEIVPLVCSRDDTVQQEPSAEIVPLVCSNRGPRGRAAALLQRLVESQACAEPAQLAEAAPARVLACAAPAPDTDVELFTIGPAGIARLGRTSEFGWRSPLDMPTYEVGLRRPSVSDADNAMTRLGDAYIGPRSMSMMSMCTLQEKLHVSRHDFTSRLTTIGACTAHIVRAAWGHFEAFVCRHFARDALVMYLEK